MKNYSLGFKGRMVQRMAGTKAISAKALSRETGVSQLHDGTRPSDNYLEIHRDRGTVLGWGEHDG